MTRLRTWIAMAAVAVVAAAALVVPRLWAGDAKGAPGRSALREAWRVRPGANPVGHAAGDRIAMLVRAAGRDRTDQAMLLLSPDLETSAVGVLGRTIVATGEKPGLLDGYDLRTGRRTWSIGTKVDGDTESPTVQVVEGMLLTVGDDVAIVDPGRVVVYGMNGLIGYR
jgi:hypothetical protein